MKKLSEILHCCQCGIIRALSGGRPGACCGHAPAGHRRDDGDERVYIVQLAAPPAVAEPRLRGERPERPSQPALETALASSPALHATGSSSSTMRVLARVGARHAKLYSYRYALNGFSARMTPAQARKLRAQKDVLNVWEDRKK